MNIKRKHWVAFVTLFLISILVAAASSYQIILDNVNPVKGNTITITVIEDNDPRPEVVVHFVLNNGLPALNITDAQGKARFIPLQDGDLNIYATTNDGILLTNTSAQVSKVASTGTPSSPGGGGGGSGGSGVITSEPLMNILKAESSEKNLVANYPVTYNLKAPEFSIYEIVITNSDNENFITLRGEVLKGVSKLVSASPPGIVYANENIWIGTKMIKEALIKFKVKNSWLENNKILSNDVRMVRWDGKWLELETTEKTKDNIYTYYEAKTGSLSSFAIIAPQPEEMISATTTPAGIAKQPEPAGTQPLTAATQGPAPSTNLWIIAGLIIVLGAAAVIYLRGRNR